MIKYTKDTDNIVTLTLDMAGRQSNILNHELVDAFRPVWEHLIAEKKRGALKGIILTSAKKNFLVGGDLGYIQQATVPQEIYDFSKKLKTLCRDLERPGVPVVAAINGSALATGFELALACHRRIVLNNPKIKLGHPEVKMGLMPGNGGVIRLLWLLGIEKAFPILANGHRYMPQEALNVNIIDELAENEEDLMAKSKKWLMQANEGRRKWDTDTGRIPFGDANQPEVRKMVQQLAAALVEKYRGNFLTPQAILNTLVEGSKVDFDTALQIEGRYFTKVVNSQQSKNMIKAFWFDNQEIRSGVNRPSGFGKFRPKRVGIIGAGMMGSGIAYSCLMRGMEVILKDVSRSVARRGVEYIEQRLNKAVAENHITPARRKEELSNLKVTETASDFADCDIVIEAVFEHASVKKKVTKEAEPHMDKYSIFGTNTISIPISEIAESSIRPENYVGLHFIYPVERVPLVEIVRGKQTSDETVARAFDFAIAIKKTPIIVKDDWGFYVARVQNTYILEGITLLLEGVPAAAIENLGLQAGMPKGPLALADDLGLNLVLKYEEQAAAHYGKKYVQHPAVIALKRMTELDRLGAQKKAGFYEYDSENRQLWQEIETHVKPSKKPLNPTKIMERMLFVQVIEASWCFHEKVILTVAEANLGSVHGWGFPSFKGGVIQYVYDYGKAAFLERCGGYEKEFGPRFQVPKVLLDDKL